MFVDEDFGGQEAVDYAAHLLERATARLDVSEKVPPKALLLSADSEEVAQVLDENQASTLGLYLFKEPVTC